MENRQRKREFGEIRRSSDSRLDEREEKHFLGGEAASRPSQYRLGPVWITARLCSASLQRLFVWRLWRRDQIIRGSEARQMRIR